MDLTRNIQARRLFKNFSDVLSTTRNVEEDVSYKKKIVLIMVITNQVNDSISCTVN